MRTARRTSEYGPLLKRDQDPSKLARMLAASKEFPDVGREKLLDGLAMQILHAPTAQCKRTARSVRQAHAFGSRQ
jgi:hypothetical protein